LFFFQNLFRFKFDSDAQKEEIKKIAVKNIKDQVFPSSEQLTSSLEDLGEAVFHETNSEIAKTSSIRKDELYEEMQEVTSSLEDIIARVCEKISPSSVNFVNYGFSILNIKKCIISNSEEFILSNNNYMELIRDVLNQDSIYISNNIGKLNLSRQDKIEIARIIVDRFPTQVLILLKKENNLDKEDIIELAKLAVSKNGEFFFQQFSKFLMSSYFSISNEEITEIKKIAINSLRNEILHQSIKQDTRYNSLIEKLFTYRNDEIRQYLIGSLKTIQDGVKFKKFYEILVDENFITPRLLPAIMPAIWMSQVEIDVEEYVTKIFSFFKKNRDALKDRNNPIMQTFLRAVISLDQSREILPIQKIKLLVASCDSLNFITNLSMITSLCKRRDWKGLASLPCEDLPNELLERFRVVFSAGLSDGLTLEFLDRYFELNQSMRIPMGLETYYSEILRLRNLEINKTFVRFLRDIITGDFKENRYLLVDNIHLQKIKEDYPDIFDKWKEFTFLEALSEGRELKYTIDWQDLFLSGSEVLDSCQRIDGDPFLNQSLLAYCLDGKNGMLAIKDDNGKLLVRAFLRLLWDGEKPALFLDRFYPHACTVEEKTKMIEVAITCAKKLGCKLFTKKDPYQREDLYPVTPGIKLSGLGGPCPMEYVDASEGMDGRSFENGIFTITSVAEIPLGERL
ncbi:MAG: hypothetical protein JSS09_03355, partial [Verrucomicrobia bacterium]|nr:hypothetical protein [Verrucomicrobiota bacterium]